MILYAPDDQGRTVEVPTSADQVCVGLFSEGTSNHENLRLARVPNWDYI